ncbi:MAG: beta-ketoacyl synthase N-terminal-like domain-containing protein [Desulfurivibrionaceae bacterium]
MKEVVICAAVCLSGLGDLDQTWARLMEGRSALSPGVLPGSLAGWPVAEIAGIDAPMGSNDRLQKLLARLLKELPAVPVEAGLLVSTTKGAPDELLGDGTGPWSGQPWDLGRDIAAGLGLRGPVSTVSAACASGTLAIIDAAQRLSRNESGSFLVLGIDLLSTFVVSGFARLHALARESCRPFDRNRDGLALGEGGGALLLATKGEARRRNWPVLAAVKAWGVSGDAGHITAPCREATGLLRALDLCTGSGSHPVGAVNAHGTGTRFNDAMEIKAFRHHLAGQIPVHSVKGAIGHCLGAAGVIEAALAVKSLGEGRIPPTVGLAEPDPEMVNPAGARPYDLIHPSIISCNSGFGGINAAVLLQSPEIK